MLAEMKGMIHQIKSLDEAIQYHEEETPVSPDLSQIFFDMDISFINKIIDEIIHSLILYHDEKNRKFFLKDFSLILEKFIEKGIDISKWNMILTIIFKNVVTRFPDREKLHRVHDLLNVA